VKDYSYSRLDTVVGCIVVSLVAACIVAVCAEKLHAAGIRVDSAEDAARALEPLAGTLSSYLFALGLLNASIFAASILPLSTSYAVCEAFGWETGVDRGFSDAPQFYVLYTALLVLGAAVVLIPGIPFMPVMFWSQVVNGLVLPVVLVLILKLVNDAGQMGGHVNSRLYNAACIAVVAVVSAVSLAAPVAMILGL
jgi:Mn2+/Fe2+ NRAMP family transporter